MEFIKVRALRGPNVWAPFPVLEAWVELGGDREACLSTFPGCADRLLGWLPSLFERACPTGQPGGLVEHLQEGTSVALALAHVALELQSLAWKPVAFGRSRETSESGVWRVVVEYRDEALARACLDSARQICLAAARNEDFDVEAEVNRLRRTAQHVCLGPSTYSIVAAAQARGIPVRRLNTESLIQLGNGVRQRRIRAAETDRTGAISEAIASDKDLTRMLLHAVGVPVPHGRPVEDAEDAWAAAQEVGTPVVVKPQFGNQGRGVATDLSTRDQVIAAFAAAKEEGDSIVVERYHRGGDYRVLVIGHEVIAASHRRPAQVVGDGVSTITHLVAEVNRDPRRGEEHGTALSKIVLNAIALAVLAEQGYTPDSVPPAGATVLIRRNANLSTGGTAEDVTDQLHPEVAARAIDAARVIGLDIAGIDVIAEDISRPLEEQDGVVVEVNAGPGLRMHLEPSSGRPRPVGEAIVDMMFPPGNDGRIPVVGVTGVNGKTTVTRLIAHIAAQSGRCIGMTCSDGIEIEGRRIESGDCSGPKSARTVLLNPKVELAVLEAARGGLLREGLGFDVCDVAVVTNIGAGDHLGLGEVPTPDALARVKRTLVEVVPPRGSAVLNADDPLVGPMAAHCKGSVIFFARDEANALVRAHVEAGGRAVFLRDGVVILAEGDREARLVSIDRVPMTHEGRVPFQVENVLAATAAAWALGLPLDTLRAGLGTFTSSTHHTPGRFNVLEANGGTVIIDYGHNPSAIEALIEAVNVFPNERRRIVFSSEGDRRDVDILRQMELLADAFDSIVIHEYEDLRGRAPGDVLAVLRQGLITGSRVTERIEAPDEPTAVATALHDLRPGDLLVIQPKAIENVIRQVRQHIAATAPKPALLAVGVTAGVEFAVPFID